MFENITYNYAESDGSGGTDAAVIHIIYTSKENSRVIPALSNYRFEKSPEKQHSLTFLKRSRIV